MIEVARNEKVQRIIAHILSENAAMLALARRFHFAIAREEDSVALVAILNLDGYSSDA